VRSGVRTKEASGSATDRAAGSLARHPHAESEARLHHRVLLGASAGGVGGHGERLADDVRGQVHVVEVQGDQHLPLGEVLPRRDADLVEAGCLDVHLDAVDEGQIGPVRIDGHEVELRHAGVDDVFVNADGFKKSISGPGAGNYITFAKAVASARSLVGEDAIQRRSFVQAHGSGTPQNRVTESHILNETAKAFGIERWPVTGTKAYVGHSIGAASGDQMTSTLGVWSYGFIPGIKTITDVADDVHGSHLQFPLQDLAVGVNGMDVVFLNAKGFGGNNATASVLAPHVVKQLLANKHGAKAVAAWEQKNEQVSEQARCNDEAITRGELLPIYLFDHGVIDPQSVQVSSEAVTLPGFEHDVSLLKGSRNKDYLR